MIDVKQVITNIELQLELYGHQETQVILHSYNVIVDNYGQQCLQEQLEVRGTKVVRNIVIMPYKSFTLQEKLQKHSDLELLKALKEIGNYMIRSHNARVIARADKLDWMTE